MSENQRSRYLSLAVALLLSALATPLLKALVEKGGHLGIVKENAVSYCNIMFVGNLCSAAIVFLYFRPTNILKSFKNITTRCWKSLLANTLLANILSPIFVISALEDGGDLTTVILLLQTNSIFYALFAWVMFGEKISRKSLLGLGTIVLGVLVLSSLPGSQPFGHSHIYTLLAAACRSLGSCLAKQVLEDESIMPAFLVLRNLIGAVGFFVLAIQMFGTGHFADAFSPGLWPLMLVYAGLVVVLAQLTWFRAVASLSSETLATWSTVVPVLAMFFAWLLVGELPDTTQWIGVVIIVGGLAIAKASFNSSALRRLKGPKHLLRPFTGA
ncbi:MAG: DMT family transporter [Planctomycetota bacterium]